jgi:hypothetical protein
VRCEDLVHGAAKISELSLRRLRQIKSCFLDLLHGKLKTRVARRECLMACSDEELADLVLDIAVESQPRILVLGHNSIKLVQNLV